jgi:hypothetical protein
MEHSPVWPVYYNMRNITNIPLRKLLRNKRFTSTVRGWGNQTTTFNYRITNIKQEYGNDDPTCTKRDWYNTVINIVCSAYTTSHLEKKRPIGGWGNLTDEERIDKRYNPKVRDCCGEYGLWSYNLKSWGNPREPRRQVRYALLSENNGYNNTRTCNDLRNFLKHVGVSGDLKIGTIKLEPTPGM